MKTIEEKGGIQGIVTVRRHPAGTIDRLKALHAAGWRDEAQALLEAGEIATTQHNIVVQSSSCGMDLIVQWLISGIVPITYSVGPQWGEIGTGTATPTLMDTALQTPTLREPISFAADYGFNEAQLQFFFPDATLANGTYTEFGTFVGTSSVIGSGQMFNHVLFSSAYSKTSGNDTTIETDVTIANL